GDPRAERHSRHRQGLRHRARRHVLRARRRTPADADGVGHAEVPQLRAPAVREVARDLRVRARVAPRRASPADAQRSGAARQGAGALSPVLDGGLHAGGEPGSVPPRPPPHDHPARRGRGVQYDLGLQAAHRGAADRLYPHHGGPRRRDHPLAPDCGPRRALPGADRQPRRNRSQPGVHGRGAAFRHLGAELRHPGIHAPHRGDRRGVPARLSLRGRLPPLRREARPRRGDRRGARGQVSVRSGVPAGGPARRRDHVELVDGRRGVTSSRIVCLGEAMVELTARQGRWDVHYGGDTLNVALHLTRLGHDVAYLTALGSDPFAGPMRQAWGREGMDVSLVLTEPGRTTGLYSIATDENGERTFAYWRGESAARRLFDAEGVERALEAAREADLLFFSLISLAILPDEGRETVLALAREVCDRGGKVAFDGNYRPRLWPDAATARVWRDRAAAAATFGLPSLED